MNSGRIEGRDAIWLSQKSVDIQNLTGGAILAKDGPAMMITAESCIVTNAGLIRVEGGYPTITSITG